MDSADVADARGFAEKKKGLFDWYALDLDRVDWTIAAVRWPKTQIFKPSLCDRQQCFQVFLYSASYRF